MSTIKRELECAIESICFKFSEDFYETIIGNLEHHGAIIPKKAKDHIGGIIQHQIGTWLPEEMIGDEIDRIMGSDYTETE